MKIKMLTILEIFAAMGIPFACLGLNMDFLALDPLRFFTDEDMQISEQTAIDSLDNNADGVASEWSNPNSESSGAITPLKTFRNEQKETCRQVRILDRTGELSGENTVYVCKGPDNNWRFVDNDRTQLAK